MRTRVFVVLRLPLRTTRVIIKRYYRHRSILGHCADGVRRRRRPTQTEMCQSHPSLLPANRHVPLTDTTAEIGPVKVVRWRPPPTSGSTLLRSTGSLPDRKSTRLNSSH